MREISVLTAQFDVPPGKTVELEDYTFAEGGPGDELGVFLKFGGTPASDHLSVFLPDETVDRLLLEIVRNAPRLSERDLIRLHLEIGHRLDEFRAARRRRLDPGPAEEV